MSGTQEVVAGDRVSRCPRALTLPCPAGLHLPEQPAPVRLQCPVPRGRADAPGHQESQSGERLHLRCGHAAQSKCCCSVHVSAAPQQGRGMDCRPRSGCSSLYSQDGAARLSECFSAGACVCTGEVPGGVLGSSAHQVLWRVSLLLASCWVGSPHSGRVWFDLQLALLNTPNYFLVCF